MGRVAALDTCLVTGRQRMGEEGLHPQACPVDLPGVVEPGPWSSVTLTRGAGTCRQSSGGEATLTGLTGLQIRTTCGSSAR